MIAWDIFWTYTHSLSIDLAGVNLAYIYLLPKRETPQDIKDYSQPGVSATLNTQINKQGAGQ
jgi:hypothetical protein